ncbi:hypothetical protein K227x_23130 [Rubripirellula lacrimiformis]|uniref:Uncharacterized protein n=1 Tax=Rubripirellula lacrimiformis TaxID=1930273 RepID=A0A517NA88_9BACT|nr:hypothetical protein K227x_23130 [Rubripirellula lacrimiformis]
MPSGRRMQWLPMQWLPMQWLVDHCGDGPRSVRCKSSPIEWLRRDRFRLWLDVTDKDRNIVIPVPKLEFSWKRQFVLSRVQSQVRVDENAAVQAGTLAAPVAGCSDGSVYRGTACLIGPRAYSPRWRDAAMGLSIVSPGASSGRAL